MGQLTLETIFRHMNKKIISSGQHGFTRRKSCLINLLKLFDERSDLEDKKRALHIDRGTDG